MIRRTVLRGFAGPAAAVAVVVLLPVAAAGPAAAGTRCGRSAVYAEGFSDALTGAVVDGVTVGGLSSLTYDPLGARWAAAVDRDPGQPARIVFFTDRADPKPAGALYLLHPDGVTPYTDADSDDEGLAVLPDGDFVVSSETGPAVRIFGRDGVQRAELPVPERFRVHRTDASGQGIRNATLEGLTVTPAGTEVIAAMEGNLLGDVAAGDRTYRRFLVWRENPDGSWGRPEQLGYRADPGYRIPEVAAYRDDALLVEEASTDPAAADDIRLYTVTDLAAAADVTDVPDLAADPAGVVPKRLAADLADCPAPPANYEGMNAGFTDLRYGFTLVTMISDDNFSRRGRTRVLSLMTWLP